MKPIQVENHSSEILFSFRDQKEMGSIAYKLLEDNCHLNFNLDSIIGDSDSLKKAKEDAIVAAKSDFNVLIRGESGTGKEIFARAIHNNSNRNKNSSIAINCSAILENLLESELFGYEDGEFREDLYYRLNVMPMDIPSLRKRVEDIVILIKHFISIYNGRYGKNIKGISGEAKKTFLMYS